jgi:hypothetical protein
LNRYVFPLDSSSSICEFGAEIAGRILISKVMEKKQARTTYNTAVRSGRGAALMERHNDDDDDAWSTHVGNVPSGAVAIIRLAYVTELPLNGNDVRFTLPMTVAPRYRPYTTINTPSHDSTSDTKIANVTTRHVIDGTPLNVRMMVQSSTSLRRITSPSHDNITCTLSGQHNGIITFVNDQPCMSRNLVLCVESTDPYGCRINIEQYCANQPLRQPSTSTEATPIPTSSRKTSNGDNDIDNDNDGDGDMALQLALCPPPHDDDTGGDVRLELITVVDRSGSMQTCMPSVITALQLIMRSLPMTSRFNIVSFGDRSSMLFPPTTGEGSSISRPYSNDNLTTAASHIANMSADMGGTELLEALQPVLEAPSVTGYPRVVLLLTDGQVTNTAQIVSMVKNHERHCRIFTFGLGSMVDSNLVRSVASSSGGECEMIADGEASAPKVMRQLTRACQPVWSDLRIDYGALQAAIDLRMATATPVTTAPSTMPSYMYPLSRYFLYAFSLPPRRLWPREPFTITLSLASNRCNDNNHDTTSKIEQDSIGSSSSSSSSSSSNKSDSVSRTQLVIPVNLMSQRPSKGRLVHVMAARTRIRELEVDGASNDAISAAVPGGVPTSREQIITLATRYGLASKYTSFVATTEDTLVPPSTTNVTNEHTSNSRSNDANADRRARYQSPRGVSSPDRWEMRQLLHSGSVASTSSLPSYVDAGDHEELEIELMDEEPDFLKNATSNLSGVAPLRIVKNPNGSLQRAALTQSALAKERRDLSHSVNTSLARLSRSINMNMWEDPLATFSASSKSVAQVRQQSAAPIVIQASQIKREATSIGATATTYANDNGKGGRERSRSRERNRRRRSRSRSRSGDRDRRDDRSAKDRSRSRSRERRRRRSRWDLVDDINKSIVKAKQTTAVKPSPEEIVVTTTSPYEQRATPTPATRPSSSSTSNLRLREDTAKYLRNLDITSAHYDPKTRSMGGTITSTTSNPPHDNSSNDNGISSEAIEKLREQSRAQYLNCRNLRLSKRLRQSITDEAPTFGITNNKNDSTDGTNNGSATKEELDEEEQLMLAEARRRLANTSSALPKRKRRSLQLDEARRWASLQKARVLTSINSNSAMVGSSNTSTSVPSVVASSMHSPPRKLAANTWSIPPSISNWKNVHGYTIPLSSRITTNITNNSSVILRTIGDIPDSSTSGSGKTSSRVSSPVDDSSKVLMTLVETQQANGSWIGIINEKKGGSPIIGSNSDDDNKVHVADARRRQLDICVNHLFDNCGGLGPVGLRAVIDAVTLTSPTPSTPSSSSTGGGSNDPWHEVLTRGKNAILAMIPSSCLEDGSITNEEFKGYIIPLVMTSISLCILRVICPNQSSEWSMLAAKAKRFLRSSTSVTPSIASYTSRHHLLTSLMTIVK